MHPFTLALLSQAQLKEAFSRMTPSELQKLDDHYHDVLPDKNVVIETDVSSNLGSEIRRALTGRYRFYRKLRNAMDFWDDFGDNFQELWDHLAHEPDIIAAALAIRPEDNWEWTVVEGWRWVYRHAALLHIDVDDFAAWCKDQDPETSRAFVEAEEKRQGCLKPASGTEHAPYGGAANANA